MKYFIMLREDWPELKKKLPNVQFRDIQLDLREYPKDSELYKILKHKGYLFDTDLITFKTKKNEKK